MIMAIESVIDLHDPNETEHRGNSSQLLFYFKFRSETNPVEIKGFEFSYLHQILPHLTLEHLVNKIVLISSDCIEDNNLYLLDDNTFKILDFLNEQEENKFLDNFEKATQEGDYSFAKLFKDHFQEESADFLDQNSRRRLNEDLIHQEQREEDPDMMFENVEFRNIRR